MDKIKNASDVLLKYELDDVDKKMLQHVLSKPAISDKELGALVGLERRRINERRNAEKFKKVLAEYLAEPIDILRSKLRKAAHVMTKMLDSTNEKLRFEAACRILYSEGVLKKENENPTSFVANVIQINKLNGDAAVYQTQFIEKPPKK